jgi:hypothetical protein
MTRSELGQYTVRLADSVAHGMLGRGPGEGLTVRTRQGYYLALQRYSFGLGGAFAGLRLGASELVVERSGASAAETRYWVANLTPEVGFQWFPGDGALFFRPYLGAAFNYALVPSPSIEGTSLRRFFISPLAGLNLGFAL